MAKKPILIRHTRRYLEEIVFTNEGDDCLIWPFARTRDGYGKFSGKIVSRLVCEKTHGPPPTPEHQAAHSCGNGHLGCVTIRHLSWKTRQENAMDKTAHGTQPVGDRNGRAKLSEADIQAIRDLPDRLPQRQIGLMFNVSQQQISKIRCGKTWFSGRSALAEGEKR